MGRARLASTIEVVAPITTVWELLMQPTAWLGTGAAGWTVEAATWDLWGGPLEHRWLPPRGREVRATSTTTDARCPDLLRWSLDGAVTGTVTFELDDLDEVTFLRVVWELAPLSVAARARLGLGRSAVVALHDTAVEALAGSLGRRAGCARVRVRRAGDRRQPVELSVGAVQLRTA